MVPFKDPTKKARLREETGLDRLRSEFETQANYFAAA